MLVKVEQQISYLRTKNFVKNSQIFSFLSTHLVIDFWAKIMLIIFSNCNFQEFGIIFEILFFSL